MIKGPNCGSRFTPMITSRPPLTICWIWQPQIVASGMKRWPR